MGNTGTIEEPVPPAIEGDAPPPPRESVSGDVACPPFALVLEAANAGESWAWHHLHSAYASRVRAYLRAQRAPEPDDLTSEVFLRVFARISSFSGDEPQFRSWLFTVAHHLLVDDVRRRRRRPVTTRAPVSDELMGAGDAELEALDLVGEQWVRELVASLPDAQREVVSLRVIADLPLADVAAVLGKRVGAVKSLQHRALAALRRSLEPGMEPDLEEVP